MSVREARPGAAGATAAVARELIGAGAGPAILLLLLRVDVRVVWLSGHRPVQAVVAEPLARGHRCHLADAAALAHAGQVEVGLAGHRERREGREGGQDGRAAHLDAAAALALASGTSPLRLRAVPLLDALYVGHAGRQRDAVFRVPRAAPLREKLAVQHPRVAVTDAFAVQDS
jgi:hypothetical protein